MKIGVGRLHNSIDWAWGSSPWSSGDDSTWSHRRAVETTLRVTGPHREELKSKGEM
jgi:hypothetical protein